MPTNDDLLTTYLGDSAASVSSPNNTDLLNLYLKPGNEAKSVTSAPVKITVRPNPPISGYTPEQSEQLNSQYNEIPSASGQPNPRASALPIDLSASGITQNLKKHYQKGIDTAVSGINDIANNQSATGIGKVVMGSLSAVPGSLISTIQDKLISEPISNLTGSKDIGEKAGTIALSGLPVAGIARAAINTMPSTRAIEALVKNIGPENLAEGLQRMRDNPRLSAMDVFKPVQSMAQGLASEVGPQQSRLLKSVDARISTAKDAVEGYYNDVMGNPVNLKDRMDKFKSDIKDAGREINPVVKNTNPVDVTPVISNIDSILKPGVTSVISAGKPLSSTQVQAALGDVRKILTDDKSNRTDPAQLHTFQSSLRSEAENLLNSSDGQNRLIGHALMDVRNQIVNAIDKASPQIIDAQGNAIGSYKPKLAKYRTENDIEDAFQKGTLITRNRLGQLDDHPTYWEDWISRATKPELDAAKEGARIAVDHQIKAMRFAAKKGTDIPEIEFNADKLKMLFGKEEVSGMMKKLKDEKDIAETNSNLFKNSQTSFREAGRDAIKIRENYKPNITALLPAALEGGILYASGGSLPGIGLGLGAFQIARRLATKAGQKLDKTTNMEIARLASATGNDRDALIKILESHVPKPKQSMLQNIQKLALPIAPP